MTDSTTAAAPAQMFQLLTGFVNSQALYVAAELGIADELLAGPRVTADLATATGADADTLRRLIRYLASLGLFRTDGDTVEVTELGRMLASGTHGSMRGLAWCPRAGWSRTSAAQRHHADHLAGPAPGP